MSRQLEAVERMKRATFRIHWGEGIFGTGFFIQSQLALTAYHVIRDSPNGLVTATHLGRSLVFDVDQAWSDPQTDIAILRLRATSQACEEPLLTAALYPAGTEEFRQRKLSGRSVVMFGYRFDGRNHVEEYNFGLLDRAFPVIESDEPLDNSGRRTLRKRLSIRLDMARAFTEGMSGAPLWDVEHGLVIGVNGARDYTSARATDVRDWTVTLGMRAGTQPCPVEAAGNETSDISSGSGVPMPPDILIGRADSLDLLRDRLSAKGRNGPNTQVLSAVRGCAGIGKTSVAQALANDGRLSARFPDGMLWISLGEKPVILEGLSAWGAELGEQLPPIGRFTRGDQVSILQRASDRVKAKLRNRQMLLFVDDIWNSEHALYFRIGGADCATLFTTRKDSVASGVVGSPLDIYPLDVLSANDSLDLLRRLAPTAVERHYDACQSLVSALGGLPLSIRVAGAAIHKEMQRSVDPVGLIERLRTIDLLGESERPGQPSIRSILKKSTDALSDLERSCFARLWMFDPKPSSITLKELTDVWPSVDSATMARTLIDWGLLEPLGFHKFQLHPLLSLHARSLRDGC